MDEKEGTICDVVKPREDKFGHLGSTIKGKRDIDKDIFHRIKVRWQNSRNASRVLYDKQSSITGGVYHMATGLPMGLVAQWAIKKTKSKRGWLQTQE